MHLKNLIRICISNKHIVLHEAWRYIVGCIVIFCLAIRIISAGQTAAYKVISEGGDLSFLGEDPNKIMSVLDSNLTLFDAVAFAFGL